MKWDLVWRLHADRSLGSALIFLKMPQVAERQRGQQQQKSDQQILKAVPDAVGIRQHPDDGAGNDEQQPERERLQREDAGAAAGRNFAVGMTQHHRTAQAAHDGQQVVEEKSPQGAGCPQPEIPEPDEQHEQQQQAAVPDVGGDSMTGQRPQDNAEVGPGPNVPQVPQGDVVEFVDLFFVKRLQSLIKVAGILSSPSIPDKSRTCNDQGFCNLNPAEAHLPTGYKKYRSPCLCTNRGLILP